MVVCVFVVCSFDQSSVSVGLSSRRATKRVLYRCKFCRLKTFVRTDMRHHLMREIGYKPYRCGHCFTAGGKTGGYSEPSRSAMGKVGCRSTVEGTRSPAIAEGPRDAHCVMLNAAQRTTVLRPFVRDYPGEPVPEETSIHSHLSCSSTILYQLHPSTMNHSIIPAQFTCLALWQSVCSTYNLSLIHI